MGESCEPRSGCPIDATIEMFGDRWSLLVRRDIVFGDRRYFRELRAGSEEGIASNILAESRQPGDHQMSTAAIRTTLIQRRGSGSVGK